MKGKIIMSTIEIHASRSRANKELKTYFNSNALVLECRTKAREKIEKAIKPDGSLDWSQLPKIITSNPKIIKGEKYGYISGILMFAPSLWSGVNMCSFASLNCGVSCLTTAGHGQEHMLQDGNHLVHIARITRVFLYMYHRKAFMSQLYKELKALVRKCHRESIKRQETILPAFRPNGTSDRRWEREQPQMFTDFPEVQFYDYTKDPYRFKEVSKIKNYHLTFSRSEDNEHISFMKSQPFNIAVVTNLKKNEPIPLTFKGKYTVDGDKHDLRFLDPVDSVVILKAKGKAKTDTSGFVVNLAV